MSISAFEHPFLTGLFGDDEEISSLFTAYADIAAMLKFEAALAGAQADLGIIPAHAAERIMSATETMEPPIWRNWSTARHAMAWWFPPLCAICEKLSVKTSPPMSISARPVRM